MDGRNAQVVGFRRTRRPPDFLIWVVQVCNKDDSPCAVLPGVDGFIDESGVLSGIFPVKGALVIPLLRLMPQDDDDFACGVNALIIVVV